MGAFSLYGLIDPCAHTGYDLVDSVLGNVSAGFFNSCNELLFIGFCVCTCALTILHTFSIGFKSGLCAGQSAVQRGT